MILPDNRKYGYTDIVFWKRVQKDRKKKTYLKCKLNRHYKKTGKHEYLILFVCFLHSVETYYENSYFIRTSYLCIKSYETQVGT